jgi:hypothetical protein
VYAAVAPYFKHKARNGASLCDTMGAATHCKQDSTPGPNLCLCLCSLPLLSASALCSLPLLSASASASAPGPPAPPRARSSPLIGPNALSDQCPDSPAAAERCPIIFVHNLKSKPRSPSIGTKTGTGSLQTVFSETVPNFFFENSEQQANCQQANCQTCSILIYQPRRHNLYDGLGKVYQEERADVRWQLRPQLRWRHHRRYTIIYIYIYTKLYLNLSPYFLTLCRKEGVENIPSH